MLSRGECADFSELDDGGLHNFLLGMERILGLGESRLGRSIDLTIKGELVFRAGVFLHVDVSIPSAPFEPLYRAIRLGTFSSAACGLRIYSFFKER